MANIKKILKELELYKYVLYDFDGTLATICCDWKSLKTKLSHFIVQKTGESKTLSPLDKDIFDIKNKYGDSLFKELIEIIGESEKKGGIKKVRKDLVRFIKSNKNISILYTMNTQDSVNFFLKEIFGEDYKSFFTKIVTKDDVKEPKPSSKEIQNILKELKINKNDIIYIGDGINDKLGGEKAGIKTIII